MSFSADVKRELCGVSTSEKSELYAELYGMLLFCNRFSSREIVYKTENKYSALRFEDLLTELFTPIIEKKSDLAPKVKDTGLYKVSIMIPDECRRIFEYYGHTTKDIKLRINRANLGAESLYAPFLRGVFLSCGSVSDPAKSYHAEFSAPFKNLSADLCKILTEVTECVFTPKTVARNGSYIVYFKGSEQICDLLAYIGAPIRAMELMGTKAVKQVRNNINRRINSEVANITKVVSASVKQLEAINMIKNTVGLEALPDDLKEIALLRLENPEMSLRALGESLSTPISRSGANHRMQRLLEFAGMEDTNG